MSRSVYVLGAGFSHNFNREEFPLIRDFLKTAKTKFIYQPENEHRDLACVISKYFHDVLYHDIEKVLSFLSASPLHDRSIPSEHRSVIYDELVEIIVRVLSVASLSRADSQATSETYERFAAHLINTESTVITFNYDLLIDNLLMQTHQWHPYDGYGVDIPVVYKAMPTSPHTYLHQSLGAGLDMRWPKATLLKLHGSINWGSPTIFEDKSEAIYQLPANEGVSIAKFAVKTEFGSPFTLYFKPVIIPPILDKSFWLRNTTFKVLWNMAMEAIDDADTITFIGYSLPVTDFMTEFMFRQGVNLHSGERKIVVVDPKVQELKSRYLDVFGSVGLADISFRESDFVTYVDQVLLPRESAPTEAHTP